MRLIKQVALDDGREINVRELTVGEIRAWFTDLDSDLPMPAADPADGTAGQDGPDTSAADVFSDLLLAEISLDDLARMTDLSVTDMNGLTQSELRSVLDCAKQINPYFFDLRTRLIESGKDSMTQMVSGLLSDVAASS